MPMDTGELSEANRRGRRAFIISLVWPVLFMMSWLNFPIVGSFSTAYARLLSFTIGFACYRGNLRGARGAPFGTDRAREGRPSARLVRDCGLCRFHPRRTCPALCLRTLRLAVLAVTAAEDRRNACGSGWLGLVGGPLRSRWILENSPRRIPGTLARGRRESFGIARTRRFPPFLPIKPSERLREASAGSAAGGA